MGEQCADRIYIPLFFVCNRIQTEANSLLNPGYVQLYPNIEALANYIGLLDSLYNECSVLYLDCSFLIANLSCALVINTKVRIVII